MAVNNIGKNAGLYSDTFDFRNPYKQLSAEQTSVEQATVEPFVDKSLSYRPELGQTRSPYINGSSGAYESVMYEDLKSSNDDSVTNQRYQELAQRESELKEKILKLEAEIAWQEKLRDNEMSGDPMWEVAKHKFIYDNDQTALENIMNRRNQEKIAADSRKQEKESRTRADNATLNNAVGMLQFDLDEFEDAALKADKSKSESDINARAAAKRSLFRTYQDLYRKITEQGKKLEEVLSPEDLERVRKYIKAGKVVTASPDSKVTVEDHATGESEVIHNQSQASEPEDQNPAKQRTDLTEQIQALRNQHKYDEAQKLLEDGVNLFNSGNSDPDYTSIQNAIAEEKRKWDAGAKSREANRQKRLADADVELTGWFAPSTDTKKEANKKLDKFRKKYPNLNFKLKLEDNGNWGVNVEVPK
jgi:hypothetical protein